MKDTFDSSIARGTARGQELAAMDAAVAAFQQEFLSLCREWMARYRDLVDVEHAHFDLYGVAAVGGTLQVTVSEDGSVTGYAGTTGSTDLGGDTLRFARALLGHYENRADAAELGSEAERILGLAVASMAGMLEQVAMDTSRRKLAEEGGAA